MKIAFFTNNYLPNVYGVPMSVETFRQEFEKLGHTVYIFAPNYSDYQDTNKNVFRYPSIDIEIKFRLPLGIPYSRKMDKLIEKLDLDIIHSHHPNLLGSAAMKWAKKKNIPLLFTWHTLYDKYTNFVPFLPSKLTASWIINKAVKYANQADSVIVPTQSIEPIIKNWGVANEKIFPVATGINEAEFSNPDRKKIREQYKIQDDETLLLLVSRLTEEKNIKFLFEAIAEVLQKNPKTKFMLVGDGYLKPELEKEAKKMNLEKQIIFAGAVEAAEIKNYYAAGDIFVYASKSETQGMIITEAMYAGLPIVAVKATGIESLVENDVNGILTSENKEEFISAIEKLIEDKDLRDKMSQESKIIAREKYTASASAQKMLEVYKQVIEENRGKFKQI
ncbi:MAG TPA: glycosyltransferase [Candidatus Moranbacteria bacterium]|nr:glycosyltransferase [Candidatus Moranbacteria bacterium]